MSVIADYATGDVGFVVETLDEPLVHVHYDSLVIRKPEKAEGVLFKDDFTNPGGGWPIVDFNNYRFGYHPPDFYHVEVKSPHDSLTVFRGLNFGDVSVDTTALVDHTTTDSGGYRYGLALRRSGDQYYAFTVSPRSQVVANRQTFSARCDGPGRRHGQYPARLCAEGCDAG